MHISNFRLVNYKSFYDPPSLELKPRFNLITGANNSGKTALIEGLGLQFGTIPHRSVRTIPTPTSIAQNQTSWADIAFTITRDELLDLLASYFSEINLPWPADSPDLSPDQRPAFFAQTAERVFSNENFRFDIRRSVTSGTISWRLPNSTSFGLYDALIQGDQRSYIVCKLDPETKTISALRSNANVAQDVADFGYRIGMLLSERVYCFKAERLTLGTSGFGINRALAPDARNLPEVLAMLQPNTAAFREYNDLVHRVLPPVKWISVFPTGAESQRILVWTLEPSTRREDLAFPLEECGTGIGQVLAIVYVVLSSKYATTIIIDEPQSFLHPGAARKLIEVLKMYPQHQFVIATHSPTIITAASPETITIVRQEDSESTFQTIQSAEAEQLRTYLAEIGARLSDVFGADNIIWAEGPTEERCFPKVLEKVARRPLMGTVIRAIKNTGDLTGRHASLIIEIYKRLSHGNSLLPPTIRFVFDDEGRSNQEKAELQQRSEDRVTFLPRRMYENYLLNSAGIAAVINSIEGSRSSPLEANEVTEWLETKGHDSKYGQPRQPSRGEAGEPWIVYVDAAKILRDLFAELTDTQESYDKVVHSVALTDWLIEYSAEDLREISDLLCGILDGQSATVIAGRSR
jgi:predicted ATPase